MNIEHNSLCRLCQRSEESILHLLCMCDETKTLWNNVQSWIFNKLSYNVPLDNFTIIMGYLAKDSIYRPFNLLLLVAKSYIFHSARTSKPLNIFALQQQIKSCYYNQKLIAQINSKDEEFRNAWNNWKKIFDNI